MADFLALLVSFAFIGIVLTLAFLWRHCWRHASATRY
jgi:hypothetical protein